MAFGQASTTVMSALGSIGAKSFRDEAYWDNYERQRGVYSVAGLAPAVQDMLAGRIDASRSILVLDYGNPLYNSGRRPTSDADIQAFVDYAVHLIQDGGHRFGYVEVWNEWNIPIGTSDTTGGNGADYARLFTAVARAIRPLGDFKILIGGSVDFWDGWQYMRAVLDGGALAHADGVGHHSYNWRDGMQATPAVLMQRLDSLQSLLSSYNGSKPVPIYVTEFGWPNWSASGFSDAQAGIWIADLMALMQQRTWIGGAWLYSLFDDGTSLADPEQGFGVFTKSGAEKPRTASVRNAFMTLSR